MTEPNKFWRGKNVFVTGATGLLGSWISRQLIENGASVTILCRDRVPHSKLVGDGTFDKVNAVFGGVEDYFLIVRALNEYEIDTVFHLAAQTITETAQRNPLGTFESNIKGTWNVLEACRQNPLVKRIVVASSDKAYGSHASLPYTEDFSLHGEYPYDVSKSCTDLIAQSYHKTYGLNIAVTRCGNLYGAGDLNFNRLIPGTIRSILLHEEPIIRSDGTFIRDYLYLQDAVDAYLLLAQHADRQGIKGNAFNVSTEKKYSVLEVTEHILKVMNSPLRPRILNIVKTEIKSQYLSSEKIRKELGWSARYDLDAGIRETVGWYKKMFPP